ncbi:hypothetical protein EON64_18250 [archaeon]|nr:MAG: hypothetical protein EON64_18250 [archaeon]
MLSRRKKELIRRREAWIRDRMFRAATRLQMCARKFLRRRRTMKRMQHQVCTYCNDLDPLIYVCPPRYTPLPACRA